MLQNVPFYHGSFRRLVETFGVVFSDIHIVRYTEDGDEYQRIEVPITYGPKEKWFVRNTQNPMPGENDGEELTFPRMGYEVKGWRYDGNRKLTSTGTTVKTLTSDNRILKAQLNPVPYNFTFQLHIGSKNVEDGLMIVEQILPFFGPEYTVTIYDMPDLNLEKDICIVHSGTIDTEDTYDGQFTDKRMITWTLTFTVKGYLYPPVKPKKINIEADINFSVEGPDHKYLPTSTITPDPSNANASNMQDSKVVRTDKTIFVELNPHIRMLSGGQTGEFDVIVGNTTNRNFTVNVPETDQTDDDTYSLDQVNGKFSYTCGSGTRTTQEILKIGVYSAADPRRKNEITLVLNP